MELPRPPDVWRGIVVVEEVVQGEHISRSSSLSWLAASQGDANLPVQELKVTAVLSCRLFKSLFVKVMWNAYSVCYFSWWIELPGLPHVINPMRRPLLFVGL